MDTITHGIAGALLGKAFFAEGSSGGRAQAAEDDARPAIISGRVAMISASLAAMFPDSDSALSFFDRTGLAVITSHRGETHSILLLPLWAFALAWATARICKWRKWPAPRLARLWLIWSAGIASHIFLDLITSFGTMIWAPLAFTRYQWDLAFILDFTMTAIVLLPQAAAWVFRRRDGSLARGFAMWILLALFAAAVRWLAVGNQVEFSWVAVAIVALILAALFVMPRWKGRGFGVERRQWCQAGLVALFLYLCGMVFAHRAALQRVEDFVLQNGVMAEEIGAIPMPPWMARWSGVIRAPAGVYQGPINLLAGGPPRFEFSADSPPNRFTALAEAQPDVQAVLRFARFPRILYSRRGGMNTVDISDYRFAGRRSRNGAPTGFTYRVTFDEAGNVLSRGWAD